LAADLRKHGHPEFLYPINIENYCQQLVVLFRDTEMTLFWKVFWLNDVGPGYCTHKDPIISIANTVAKEKLFEMLNNIQTD